MLNTKYDIKQIGENKTLELFLYGEIQDDYFDYWNWKKVESTTSANYIRKALDDAGNVQNVNIYINSVGGSVQEGIAIYNILKRTNAFVTAYIDAFAYSVASVIAMSADKIVMPSNTTMMIHNAMMGVYGNAHELRKGADDLDVINNASCNSYLAKAGNKITKEKLIELLDAETFLTAEQALEYGFCDEIANPVDLSQSTEVIEQAQRNKNPQAKLAMQVLQSNAKEPPEPKELPEQADKFDIFQSVLKNKNYL